MDELTTVVVPVRNRVDLIQRCLESIRVQEGARIQCLIIDSCSTDGTSEVVADFIRRCGTGNVAWDHLVELDSGQSEAINKGLDRASGEYFAWLNADDYWEPCFLNEAQAVLRAKPDAVFVSGAVVIEDASRREIQTYAPTVLTAERLLETDGTIVQPSTLFRTQAIRSVGGLDAELHYAMDYDLYVRLLMAGTMVATNSVWAHFLLDGSTKSGTSRASFFLERWRVRRRYHAPLWSAINRQALVFWLAEPLRHIRRLRERLSRWAG